MAITNFTNLGLLTVLKAKEGTSVNFKKSYS